MKMTKAQKWNPKTRRYTNYKLPIGCFLYTDDLEREVACAKCGTFLEYGDTFTSKTIHNSMGLGFPVCEECYNIEIQEEKKQ